jgi:hypothetical protein
VSLSTSILGIQRFATYKSDDDDGSRMTSFLGMAERRQQIL